MEEIHKQESGVDIIEAFSSEEIPKIYVNGFANFQGNSDMGIAFRCNGKINVVVNMSFTLAKTLAEKIGQMVIDFEETTETEIMTTSVIDEKIRKQEKS